MNLEIKAFSEITTILEPNQIEKSADAFVIMAGIFQPPSPGSVGTGRRGAGAPAQVRYKSSRPLRPRNAAAAVVEVAA